MTLLEALISSLHCESVDRAVERVLRAHSTTIIGEHDSLAALMIAMIAAESTHRGIDRIIAVAPTRADAEVLHDDLASLLSSQLFLCPQREAFPGDRVGLPPNEQSERALALEALTLDVPNGSCQVVVLPAGVLLEAMSAPPPPLRFVVGELVDPEELTDQLISAGFDRETMVSEPAEFARRGGIFDIFGWGDDKCIRIEFDDIEIVSIRRVDPGTQRFTEEVSEAIVRIQSPVISSGEFLLSQLSRERTRIIITDTPGVQFAWNDWQRGIEERPDVEHPPYLTAKAATQYLSQFTLLEFGDFKRESGFAAESFTIEIKRAGVDEFRGDLDSFEGVFRRLRGQGWNCFLLCDNERQRERLYDLFDHHEDSALIEMPIYVPSLHHGFTFPEAKIAIFTEHQLFGRTRRRGRHRKFITSNEAKRQLDGLRRGDYVVHVDYGIGRFEGFERITVAESRQDCFKVMFYGNVAVYVRMEQFAKLQPYRAEETQPQLSRIGGSDWSNARTRARKLASDMAKQILELYATRAVIDRPPAGADGAAQHEFEAAFEYEETPDQLVATEEIKSNLESSQPMDRLLIGDVGFGKTEVAMRATWKVLQENRQVAVVCPTTVLAAQHGSTFRDRFRYTGANIAVLSRFTPTADVKTILLGLREGTIDVLIGTHRILAKDIEFRRLGLLIVDEEHKFGVKHKDDLRRKRVEVDVLSLSATPIPRTMQMALSGARDVSYIRTAPAERLPIETEVAPFDERLIREAIMREISRGGQVFFVHNRVETMPQMKMRLEQIVPGIKIGMGHAQLPGHELEKIMLDFLGGRYQVLLSSMIIESGIDLPNVNTLIVNRADMLGLAQLYQLRGRIGRSNRQAYAWLLTPAETMITPNARKRLRTLQEFTSLGGGYNVALRDLEIRGAGNLLGKEQSGMIAAIGFDLYLEMLEDAINAMRSGTDPDTLELAQEEDPIRIELPGEALIPTEYIPAIPDKVDIYRRLERLREASGLTDLRAELRDRFGPVPDSVDRLLLAVRFRIAAQKTDIKRIAFTPTEAILEARLPASATSLQDPLVGGWVQRIQPIFQGRDGWVTNKPLGIRMSWKVAADPFERASQIANELTAISLKGTHDS